MNIVCKMFVLGFCTAFLCCAGSGLAQQDNGSLWRDQGARSDDSPESDLAILQAQSAQILAGAGTAATPTELSPTEPLEPGDLILVQVWMHDRISQLSGFPYQSEIDEVNEIFIPHIGRVNTSGQTAREFQQALQERFAKFLNDPTVVVRRRMNPAIAAAARRRQATTAVGGPAGTANLTATNVPHIVVLGRISRPGVYELTPNLRVREAIATAGGFDERRGHGNIFLVRGTADKPEVLRVNLYDILEGHDLSKNYELQNNDAIYVATKSLWKLSDFISMLMSPIMAVRDSVWVYDRLIKND